MAVKLCSIVGCEKQVGARGWCWSHYRAWYRNQASPCSIENCTRPAETRGWCSMHYQRWKRTGSPGSAGNVRFDDPVQSFEHRIEKRLDGCWIWTGATNGRYGMIRIKGHALKTHRFAYELYVGLIPDDMELDHLCRQTLCVNPAHLEPVSHRENILRGIQKKAAA